MLCTCSCVVMVGFMCVVVCVFRFGAFVMLVVLVCVCVRCVGFRDVVRSCIWLVLVVWCCLV